MGKALANHKYRLKIDYYDANDNDIDRIKFAPSTLDQEQWRQFVTWLNSLEFQIYYNLYFFFCEQDISII